MGRRSRRRKFNLANWLVAIGVLVLALSFLIPFATAGRTARVEDRADRIVDLLLEHASLLQPFDPADPLQLEVLLGRVLLACAMAGIPAGDLALVGATEDGLAVLFRNKHYCFMVTATPELPMAPEASPDAAPPLEAYAWPRSAGGPGHAAFFYSETGAPSFTRNLQANYHGLDLPRVRGERRPQPGDGQRRGDSERNPFWYRGRDDERWIVHVRPE